MGAFPSEWVRSGGRRDVRADGPGVPGGLAGRGCRPGPWCPDCGGRAGGGGAAETAAMWHGYGHEDTPEITCRFPPRPLASCVTALATPVIVGRYPRHTRCAIPGERPTIIRSAIKAPGTRGR